LSFSEVEIGQRILILRNKLQLSQAGFGAKIGVHQSSVSAMEKGTGYITAGNLASIAEAFDVNLNWLYFGIGPILWGEGIAVVSEKGVITSQAWSSLVDAEGIKDLLADKELCNEIGLTMEDIMHMNNLVREKPDIFESFDKLMWLHILYQKNQREGHTIRSVIMKLSSTLKDQDKVS
jgi:transcriptional regulator with XRE-family HTH domain